MADWVAQAVYILCALTSLACALLLLRGYARSKTRLLMWAGLCFLALAADNVILFFDLVIFSPGPDLRLYRNAAAFVGLALLIYGLVWDSE
jgi:hypothetical protein